MNGFDLTADELKLFLEEAHEQLGIMEDVLIELEQNPDRHDLIQEIFRAAHTIKGGAATIGFEAMATLAHAAESLLDLIRQGERRMSAELGDVFFATIDDFRRCLGVIDIQDGGAHRFDEVDVRATIEQIDRLRSADQSDDAVDLDRPDQEVDLELAQDDAVSKLIESGETVFHIAAGISPGTAMPSVRAYQVILTLDDYGMVVRSKPDRALIEEETIDLDRIEVLFVPRLDVDEVRRELDSLTFLTDVAWHEVREKARRVKSDPVASGEHGLGQTIRIDVSLLDKLMNLVGELVIDRTRLVDIERSDVPLDALNERLAEVSSRLSRITTDLQETIMQARMMPVGVLFKKFPRMVRDLARQLDKDIHLELVGEETELDRSVIEHIGDPLMHLLRNAVDHGIEAPDERIRLGKPRVGLLTLSAEHKEGHIFITVQDDGRGLDLGVIRQKLVDRGLISAERLTTISDDDVLNMIFLPGFSTAESVSAVSGRGVGMDVVKQNIDKVKGSVQVSTAPGIGTEITIKLPLTLAIIQALLVEVAGEVLAIPLSAVTEVIHLDPTTIRFAQGKEIFPVRDHMLPLLDPGDVWGPKWTVDWTGSRVRPVVIMRAGLAPVGIKVDRLRGEQEVVIKNMSPVVGSVPGVSGASILGDGKVALIVDPAGLTEAMRQQLDQAASRSGGST